MANFPFPLFFVLGPLCRWDRERKGFALRHRMKQRHRDTFDERCRHVSARADFMKWPLHSDSLTTNQIIKPYIVSYMEAEEEMGLVNKRS